MVLTRCTMVLTRCTMVLARCTMVLTRCTMVLTRCTMVFTRCTMVVRLAKNWVYINYIGGVYFINTARLPPPRGHHLDTSVSGSQLNIIYMLLSAHHGSDTHQPPCNCFALLDLKLPDFPPLGPVLMTSHQDHAFQRREYSPRQSHQSLIVNVGTQDT